MIIQLTRQQNLAKERLYIALDGLNINEANNAIDMLAPYVNFKIGMEMFTAYGQDILNKVKSKSAKIFLDMKYHDIPTTVGKALYQATKLGVDIINVHASGGSIMMMEAVNQRDKALSEMGKNIESSPDLIAVTVLTTIDQDQFNDELLLPGLIEHYVLHLAKLSYQCGMDGIVCSAKDLDLINNELPDNFLRITPGIRFAEDNSDDQIRILPPNQAIRVGATHLVVGRPIMKSKTPVQSAIKFLDAIALEL